MNNKEYIDKIKAKKKDKVKGLDKVKSKDKVPSGSLELSLKRKGNSGSVKFEVSRYKNGSKKVMYEGE